MYIVTTSFLTGCVYYSMFCFKPIPGSAVCCVFLWEIRKLSWNDIAKNTRNKIIEKFSSEGEVEDKCP